MTHKMLSQDNRRELIKPVIAAVFFLCVLIQIQTINAGYPDTIRRMDLAIDLGGGLETIAQVTYPVIGEGPFPAILLVPGGGLTDMDEYLPAYLTTTGEPAAPMRQIADYLSERGFIVLRYNKRGVTRNATMANYPLYAEATVDTFKTDAEKALRVLRSNSLAGESLTLIGHSESSIIVTRMAADDPSIRNVVMLGASARDYLDIKHTQIVELRVKFAEDVLDQDADGLVSLDEAVSGMEPYNNAIIPRSSMLMSVGNETGWIPSWDPNGDGQMNLTSEFIPVLERLYSVLTNPDYPGYNQTQAHVSQGATMDMIGDLNSSILILQGEGDYQTPTVEAVLLEQALLDAGHPDHTLKMYPGLSHFFHPTDGWKAGMGPVEPYVLEDLYRWLVSPDRDDAQVTLEINGISDVLETIEVEFETGLLGVEHSLSSLEEKVDNQKVEGGKYYMTPALTVILLMIIIAVRKQREN